MARDAWALTNQFTSIRDDACLIVGRAGRSLRIVDGFTWSGESPSVDPGLLVTTRATYTSIDDFLHARNPTVWEGFDFGGAIGYRCGSA